MSKLIDELTRRAETSPQRLGFKRTEAPKEHPMLLVSGVSLEDRDWEEGGFDDGELGGVLGYAKELKGDTLQNMAKAVGDVPMGLCLEQLSEETLSQCEESSIDFVVFKPERTTASLLQKEKIGRIVEVNWRESDVFLSALQDLPVDALLVDIMGEDQVSVRHCICCHSLVRLIPRPLLIVTDADLTEESLRALWDSGVSGVILRAKKKKELSQKLGALRELVKTLPATRSRITKDKGARLPLSGGKNEKQEELA